jgi:hypothetical protein
VPHIWRIPVERLSSSSSRWCSIALFRHILYLHVLHIRPTCIEGIYLSPHECQEVHLAATDDAFRISAPTKIRISTGASIEFTLTLSCLDLQYKTAFTAYYALITCSARAPPEPAFRTAWRCYGCQKRHASIGAEELQDDRQKRGSAGHEVPHRSSSATVNCKRRRTAL